MRMWMVDPAKMCRQHLAGEHRECHALNGTFQLRKQIQGYIESNCIEPLALKERHDALAEELRKRKSKKYEIPLKDVVHATPLDVLPDFSYLDIAARSAKVDRESSCKELINRCSTCAKRFLTVK